MQRTTESPLPTFPVPTRCLRQQPGMSLMGSVHSQIDFILTPQRFKCSINKANTIFFPDADIGSDHDLVFTTIKSKLKNKRFTNSPCIRLDLEKFKDPKLAEEFQAKVGGKFAAFCVLDSDVGALASSLKEGLFSTAEEVLGRQRKKIQLRSQTRFWICATRDGS